MARAAEPSMAELLEAERGARRTAFGRCSAALVFPNTYHVGMSTLAVHALYRLINAHPEFWCDRAFAWPDGRAVAMETGRSLADFDVIALSIAYELDEVGAVELLGRAGIPAKNADRDERHPLVVCGGVAPTLNPEPLAPFVDLFLLGEVEETLPALLDAIGRSPERDPLFEAAGNIPGCYVPVTQSAPPEPVCVLDLDAHPTASVLVTPYTEFADRVLVEISRGCTRACRFCATRGLYGRARMRRAETVLESARRGMELTDKVGLVGATIVDHPDADRLYAELAAMGAKVSVSSFQADHASDALLGCLAAGGQRTVTIAPETGSERLRRALGKRLTDDDVIRCAESAKRHGLRFVKLYFMLGLPGETDADVAAAVRLVERTAAVLPTKVAVAPFVPKRFTPFADAPVLPRAELQRRARRIRGELRRLRNVTVTIGSIRQAQVETLLSQGGREVADLLEQGAGALRTTAAQFCAKRSSA